MFTKAAWALKPWIITFVVVLATGYFKLLLNQSFHIESPFLLFFAAIAVSAWSGGFRQGVTAITISTLFIWHFFIAVPENHTGIDIWTVRTILYFFDGLAIAFVCSALRQSLDKLKGSESRLRLLFKSNMIGLCVSDPDGNVIEANDYYLNLLGAIRLCLKQVN